MTNQANSKVTSGLNLNLNEINSDEFYRIFSSISDLTDRLSIGGAWLKINPQDSFINFSMASDYMELGEYGLALNYSRNAVELDPMNISYLGRCGEIEIKVQDYISAFKTYASLFLCEGLPAWAYINIGNLFEKLDLKEDALLFFFKSNRLTSELLHRMVNIYLSISEERKVEYIPYFIKILNEKSEVSLDKKLISLIKKDIKKYKVKKRSDSSVILGQSQSPFNNLIWLERLFNQLTIELVKKDDDLLHIKLYGLPGKKIKCHLYIDNIDSGEVFFDKDYDSDEFMIAKYILPSNLHDGLQHSYAIGLTYQDINLRSQSRAFSFLEKLDLNDYVVKDEWGSSKKLLFVDYALPLYDKYAGSRTNYMYVQALVGVGFNVIYLPTDFQEIEPYATDLRLLGVEILVGDWYKNNWKKWLQDEGNTISYVFINKPDPGMKVINDIRKHTNATVIYQCHDLHYLRLRRRGELNFDTHIFEEADFYEAKEHHIFSLSDAILTFSNLEEEIIKRNFPNKKVYTLPLYFYDEVPKLKLNFNQRENLLFVGGFGHAPNLDGVLWFCKEVFPLILNHLPNIVFNIVGANPPQEIIELESKNIKILGSVTDDQLKSLYDNSRLSVIPLRFGAGVKGKVIESLYNGVPLVSTSIGLEGIVGIDELIQPKDDPRAFSNEIIELYQDEASWLRTSRRYVQFIAENYMAKSVTDKLKEIFASAEIDFVNNQYPVDDIDENPIRTIAFYLPQFHPIRENNNWWGEGFTEWRNVAKAQPLFDGHYQPHLPADLGFYDLRLEEARVSQADMAREYGINGFCYYHYWFDGKRLLEAPAEKMLSSGKPDFPFCLCWANENWTRRWDGKDSEILIQQTYSEADDIAHIRDLFRFFNDSRYIRVNGKPLFLVYRVENLPNPEITANIWRNEAIKAGVGDLYLVAVESMGNKINPAHIGFDAALEFAPNWNKMGSEIHSYTKKKNNVSELIELPMDVVKNNYIRDYAQLMKEMLQTEQPSYKWFRCVVPSWDNSARRISNAVILLNSSPELYSDWLKEVARKTLKYNDCTERLIFVNAWNEWAEGNHLEPCLGKGRDYLQATKRAIKEVCDDIQFVAQSLQRYTQSLIDKYLARPCPQNLTDRLFNLIQSNLSPKPVMCSVDSIDSIGTKVCIKGWASINDEIATDRAEILLLIDSMHDGPRLVKPSLRKRNDLTTYFNNGRNYDYAGFECLINDLRSKDKVYICILRNDVVCWQHVI